MSDIEEVAETLASTIVGIINANGPTPAPLTVAPGWPVSDDLNGLLRTGSVHISIYPQAGSASNVTRWQWNWQVVQPAVLTTAASVSGGVVTFSGSITPPLNVAVTATHKVYVYSATSSDTLDTIASGLAALISVDQPATASGPVLTVPSVPADFKVVLGGMGTILRENARSKQSFQITVWAPTQALRVATSKAFEAGLYALNSIALPDGTAGMLLPMREFPGDAGQVEGLYRRDVIVTVEYGITETAPAWAIVTAKPVIALVPGPGPLNPFPPII